jgi:hypothetical protein
MTPPAKAATVREALNRSVLMLRGLAETHNVTESQALRILPTGL